VHSGALADPAHAVTGTCIVMITPDSERSMNTHLGATADLDASALNADALGIARCTTWKATWLPRPPGWTQP
jgi:fructokinase